MMMPANYSAIAENEMTYVVGGETLSTLFTNVVNIIGNTFVQPLVDATIGKAFGGHYEFGSILGGMGETIKGAYNNNLGTDKDHPTYFNGVLNAGAKIVGGMAAVAQLMNNDVKVYTKENVVKFN